MTVSTKSATRRELRILPALELSPSLIAFVQRPSGVLVLGLVSFAVLAFVAADSWRRAALAPALCVLFAGWFPSARRQILLIASIGMLWLCDPFQWGPAVEAGRRANAYLGNGDRAALLVGALALFGGLRQLAGRFPEHPLARSSFLLSLSIMAAALVASQLGVLGPLALMYLWAAIAIGSRFFWFYAYSMAGKSTLARRPLWRELGHYMPVWNYLSVGSVVPYGKGEAYLAKAEAREHPQLAAVQLRGLKLLLWAGLLSATYNLLNRIVFGETTPYASLNLLPSLDFPTLLELLRASEYGRYAPIPVSWAVVVGSFLVHEMLFLAATGHAIVGAARLLGFDILRNTCRPLSSTTIAEFFNRYYYYFKELLVDFFFYPTFLRCFRSHPRLRIFFATFMAAGVGNALYHYLRDFPRIAKYGVPGSIRDYSIQLLYCAILGVSIGLSQLSGARRRAPVTALRRLASNAFVLLFFSLLLLFGEEGSHSDLSARIRLLAHLFGAL